MKRRDRFYAESADVEHDTSTILSQYDFGVDEDDDETTVAHADIAMTALVYKCRSHKSCLHRLRIIKKDVGGGQTRYQLMQKGNHSHVVVDIKEHGISAAHKSEIDSLLQLGMGAGRIRNLLMHKYSNDPELLKRIPKRFQDYVFEGDKEIPTLGLIFTSRALFGNVKKAVEAQGTSLAMSTDGTYRIHCLGWTLVDAGGIAVEWETTEHVHRFRPWLYMFVRTECSLAYERMFATLVTCAKRFFDINVKVATCSIDHSSAIASALKTV
ncbi:unnamed protein product [Phytophthora lilii]|uniref:Unnamed protein product n=1 Tax=Phytophthora lilii TaxID=2077276 RepID=A0A9W6TG34_9STRA|nr:unnamed protein product [Phytophthora lilii]